MLDHEPLSDACRSGGFLPLYIVEPKLWERPDVSYRHYYYLQHYLKQLDEMLYSKLAEVDKGMIENTNAIVSNAPLKIFVG